MFNWFKNNRNYLVPSDINKGFMSSNFVTIKLGDKLIIPENLVCFVSYHDKIYAELETGNYILDKELLLDLYSKQQKGNQPLKKLKIDLFFVNKNAQNLSLSYVDKIPVSKKMTKFIFDVNLTIKVENTKTFNKFVCAEFYSVTASSSKSLVSDYTQEFLKKYFLKINLTSYKLPSSLIEEIEQKLGNYLNKLGLNLVNFSLNVVHKTKYENVEKSSFFESLNEKKNNESEQENIEATQNSLNNLVDQNEKLNYTINEPNKQTLCPNCNSKIIKGSLFCHRCGHNL